MYRVEYRKVTSAILIALMGSLAVAVAFAPLPAPSGAGPTRATDARGFVFVVHAFANGTQNGTGNGTGNKTAAPCSAAANDECWRNIVALLDDWTRFSSYVLPWINVLIYGFVGFILLNVAAWFLVIRWVRKEREAMKQDRIGAEDYRNYDLFENVFNALMPKGSREREAIKTMSLAEKKRAVEKEIAELKALKAEKAKAPSEDGKPARSARSSSE